MSNLFNRAPIILAWLIIVGLVAVIAGPLTLATRVLLVIIGVVPSAIMFTLWKAPSPTIAEVLHRAEASPRER
jgi:hypothetical protein